MKPTLIALLALFLSLPLVAADKNKPLPKDFKSLKVLAEKGNAKAQYKLGWMYRLGQGVEQDFKEAVKWYKKAADQGYAIAQGTLGGMYYNGLGVGVDNVIAYAWWNIEATNGGDFARRNMSIVAKKMTPTQITQAEELVKEMIKKNPKLLNK